LKDKNRPLEKGMKKRKKKSFEIPLEILAEEALKKAVANAIADHKRTGDPIVIWKDGKVVRVPADQIVVKEPEVKYRTSK
jgi:ABC-type proline/glycine betaine transport system ATPase subunit